MPYLGDGPGLWWSRTVSPNTSDHTFDQYKNIELATWFSMEEAIAIQAIAKKYTSPPMIVSDDIFLEQLEKEREAVLKRHDAIHARIKFIEAQEEME